MKIVPSISTGQSSNKTGGGIGSIIEGKVTTASLNTNPTKRKNNKLYIVPDDISPTRPQGSDARKDEDICKRVNQGKAWEKGGGNREGKSEAEGKGKGAEKTEEKGD